MTTKRASITPEIAAAALVLEAEDAQVEDGDACPTCGDYFEAGQQMLSVYAPEWLAVGRFRAVWDVHLRCYQGEELAG